MEIFRSYGVVVDGTDNFPTLHLANDACVLLGIPLVYGSVFRLEGQASVFATATSPADHAVAPGGGRIAREPIPLASGYVGTSPYT